MDKHSFGLSSSRKTLAVMTVALLMAVTLVPIAFSTSGGNYAENSTAVVYHSYYQKPDIGNGDYIIGLYGTGGYKTSYFEYNKDNASDGDRERTQEMKYYGNVWSTEYNPQLWTSGPGDISQNWYDIVKYSSGAVKLSGGAYVEAGRTLVFTGWKAAVYDSEGNLTGVSETTFYPGEVIPKTVQNAAKASDGKIHVYATWGYLNYTDAEDVHRYTFDGKVGDTSSLLGVNGYVTVSESDTESNMFTNIVGSFADYVSSGNCTIDPTIKDSTSNEYNLNTTVSMAGNLTIQNTVLRGYSSGNHGDDAKGLFACGHVLIMGLGITDAKATTVQNHPQVFGGYPQNYRGVSSTVNHSSFGGEADSLASMVIIHSGIYRNVIGGSHRGSIDGSTYISIRGATVLDTMAGGCSGSSSSGTIKGSAFIYATNANMPGDTYEEKFLGTNMGNTNGVSAEHVSSNESTILTGGSVSGSIEKDTYVYLSGTTAVWDVQAAGRCGNSSVNGTAHLDISGKSIVKHSACGSITDGISNNSNAGQHYTADKKCVRTVDVSIHDDAKVAAVFGAGYDTFYNATYASMYGSDSSINLTVDGGVVGYVYGGGYRGTVGTAKNPLDHVSISISGGKILGDVFVGGRGGLDKVCHNVNGSISWGVSDTDSTGYSIVYAKNIKLEITGGTVDGNVYGGGESVPVISSYNGLNWTKYGFKLGTANTFSDGLGVASVVAENLEVSISGAFIKGDLYGAGKGVDVTAAENGRHGSAYMFTINGNGNIIKIPWIGGSAGSTETVRADYSNYASVTTNKMTVTVKNSTIGYYKDGNVYGGGALGLLNVKDTYAFSISDTDTVGSVFGGGKGSADDENAAAVNAKSFSLEISGTGHENTIGGSVYGGGALSKFTSASPVALGISNCSINGSVYGGGKGTDAAGKESWALFTAPSVSVEVSGADVRGSVYGGGALGILKCENSVSVSIINGSNIGDSVYGGGKGSETNAASAGISDTDSVTVSVVDSTVLDSVYGGGEMSALSAGRVCVSVTGGSIIEGSIFGGGKGLSDANKTEWALLKADTKVVVNGSGVKGSVYGGGRLSRTEGAINTEITGSTVGGSVFGGGLGASYTVSTVGSRTTKLSESAVNGSVFGSSSLGNDNGGDSVITVDNTSIGASVYGGGFKGELTGNTSITVNDNVGIKFSVYGGADIGNVTGTTLDTVLVHGHSEITVSGSGISIGRSIFGSGNSCKVYKEGESNTICIENIGLNSTKTMESIQSADYVDIHSSKIILTGRSDASMSQASTKFSVNHIKFLRLHDNTSLDLRASVGDLEEYGSYAGSNESTMEAPSNTIVLNNGTIFSVMGDDGKYGLVHGYTYLSKNSSDVYGAYAYGSIDTDGNSGFCVHSDGKYTKLEPSVFVSQGCKCWFLKGTLTHDITAVAPYGNTSTTVSSVIPVSYTSTGDSKESYIIFTGATPVVLRSGSMNLVDGYCDADGNFSNASGLDTDSFGLFVGTKFNGDGKSTMTFNGGKGINALSSPGSDYDGFIGERNGMPIVSFTLFFNKNVDYTGYVGYVLLHFIEATKTDNGEYQTYNDIVVRLAIHMEGDTQSFVSGGEYIQNISLNKGDGQSTFSIPRSFKDYTLWYAGSEVADTNAFDRLFIQTVSNEGNTFGWNNPMGSPVPVASVAGGSAIDSLKGTHAAALRFSFVDCDAQSETVVRLNFVLKPDTAGADIGFSIVITVSPVKSYNVTFHSPEYDGSDVTISVTDGNVIHSTLIPVTGKYFIGWFTDSSHTVRFDFGTPVTNDLDLYADYKYTVRFIHGNGTVSTYYVDIRSGGSEVYKPEDPPARYGYEFANWVCGNRTCFVDLGYEIVTDDTDFTAVWKGAEVEAEFVVETDGFGDTQKNELEKLGFVFLLKYDFGTTYGSKYAGDTGKSVFENNTVILKKYLADNGFGKFIRWGLYDSDGNFQNSYVYEDMYIKSTSYHILKAQIDDAAIMMVLDPNKPSDLVYDGSKYPDPSINAPVKSLLYGTDKKYTLSPSSGSLKGYTLKGWSYDTDNGIGGFIGNGSSAVFALSGNTVSDESGNTVSYDVCSDGSEFNGAYRIVLKAVWVCIDYTMTVDEPLGGAAIEVVGAKNHRGENIAFSFDKLHYLDVVTLRYLDGNSYTFSEWVCKNDCTVVSEDRDGKTITVQINGFCTVAVRQGGMYGVDIALEIDGVRSTDYALALNNGSESMSLRVIGDKYSHSLIPSGEYSLMINYGGIWYAVDKLDMYGPYADVVSLRTINVAVNDGYGDKVSCPPLAKVGSTVTVSLKEGHEITESDTKIENNSFVVDNADGPKNVSLTIAKIKYVISVADRSEYGCSVTVKVNGTAADPDSKDSGIAKYSAEYGSDVQIVFVSDEWHVFRWFVNEKEYATDTDGICFSGMNGNKDVEIILKSHGGSVQIDEKTYSIFKSATDYERDGEGNAVYSLVEMDSVFNILNAHYGTVSFAVSGNVIQLISPTGPVSGHILATLLCNDGSVRITLNIILVGGAASAGGDIASF